LNLTGASPSSTTKVFAYPNGSKRPAAADLAVRAGDTRSNFVLVKVGKGGRVLIATTRGSVSISVDVSGYFSATGLSSSYGQGGAPHVTQGQVTALNQTITASEGAGSAETLSGMIQSDAVIYQGDSGGALVNTSSQVVGMITAGEAQGFRSAASSTGYAIASNTAVGVANRIRAHEQAADLTYGQVGYLGVAVQSIDASGASQLGLNVSSGALVSAAPLSGTPAASAGITKGSVITKVGGSSVTSADTLGTAVKSHKPGDRVSVTWVNTSGSHTAIVTLGGVNP